MEQIILDILNKNNTREDVLHSLANEVACALEPDQDSIPHVLGYTSTWINNYFQGVELNAANLLIGYYAALEE